MYKVGDKVEYRGEVVKITQIFYSDSERACMVSNGNLEAYAHLSYLGKHKSAHEKLIELGWECVDNDKKYAVYRKTTLKNQYHSDYIQLEVIKRTKTFGAIQYYNDNFNSQYSHHQFNFDLTLSRILTQYLEELENE